MIKEIKYNGYSAAPGDHEALEGDLAVAMNLIPEHNTIRPVLPPKVVAAIPGDPYNQNDKGRKIVCIHQTSAFKHFIVAIEFGGLSPQHPPYTYLYRWDGTEGSSLAHLGYKAFNEVYKVEPIGNTLVVLADDGIHYFLWKQGDYHYLGNHLPELDLRFSMDEHSLSISSDEYKYDPRYHIDQFDEYMDTPFSYINGPEGKDTRSNLCNGIMAAVNQVVGRLTEQRLFTFPFFVRYAYRLYDSSITMHSAPCLMIPTMNKPLVDMGWDIGSNEYGPTVCSEAKIKASFTGYGLWCRCVDDMQVIDLARWSDIITSVDIFVSPQFYTYDQDPTDDKIIIGTGSSDNQPPDNSQFKRQIVENGNFFLVCQIPVSSQDNSQDARLKTHGGEVALDFEPTNTNIVDREPMTDDYGSHDELFAQQAFAYNNRINLAGISKRLFRGFNPACMWTRQDINQVYKPTTATVAIETSNTNIVVQRKQVQVKFDANNTVVWFYYPNPAAKRAYLDINGNKVQLNLLPHAMLNGAYFCSLEENAVQQTVSSIPSPSPDNKNIVEMPSKVCTSEADNPFFFPSTGINTVNARTIYGMCAAVRPVSTGQFGYADLYIFTDKGVWVAKINNKGSYDDINLVTGDVCINADSITQMETSVLFASSRGIMLISGSQAQCISGAIDDDGQPFGFSHPSVDTMCGMINMHTFSIGPFKDFLPSCSTLYDYAGQRIIAYNPNFSYAYIYSLESNRWGMMECNIAYTIRDYPNAMAVNRHDNGELINCSVGDGNAAVNALLVTRPLTLDLPDVLKTVNTVLQRGIFSKRNHHVKSVLFGSRDLTQWFAICSSDNENLRGFRGTPFKWFRIALPMQLGAGESVQGCSIDFEPRYTNRLR